MRPIKFNIKKQDEQSLARYAILETKHGEVETPAFVPVATKATLKSLTPEQIKSLGVQIMISNTYHLYLEPSHELIKKAGGLHKFMNWDGPLMTDSGGFQVFSLGVAFGKELSKILHNEEELKLGEGNNSVQNRQGISEHFKPAKIDEEGVMFRSHIDGSAHYFTPEKSIEIQHNLGADIIFAFDECTSPTESKHYQRQALDRTHRWAKKCLNYHRSKENSKDQALFAVIQGGRDENLRKESAEILGQMDFDGYGIGGSFEKKDMSTAVKWSTSVLPKDRPIHLLGIGEPEDILMGIENGCDLFDCVIPTRIARNAQVFTKTGKINLENSKYREDLEPIEKDCDCYTCQNFSKAYLAHLFRTKEILASTLASIHNVRFLVRFVDQAREAIKDGEFVKFKKDFLDKYL